jgi:hypothetical protein
VQSSLSLQCACEAVDKRNTSEQKKWMLNPKGEARSEWVSEAVSEWVRQSVQSIIKWNAQQPTQAPTLRYAPGLKPSVTREIHQPTNGCFRKKRMKASWFRGNLECATDHGWMGTCNGILRPGRWTVPEDIYPYGSLGYYTAWRMGRGPLPIATDFCPLFRRPTG